MGFRLYLRADEAQYDSLKHSLIIDDVWQDAGSATVSAKHVTSINALMPVKLACNTISSLTFGGNVRGWTTLRRKATEAVQYDIDCDDWRPMLNRDRFCATYTSVAINSVAMHLVSTHATSFSTAGIHSMLSVSGSLTWPAVTVTYRHNTTISEALDSLVAMAPAPVPSDPPVWGVGADRIVRLVGAGNSYGTTVVVDDADLDLRTFEVAEIANSVCTRVYVWGGSATVVTSLAAGANSLRTYQNEVFWGPPMFFDAPVCSLYVAVGTELLPVVSANTATGDQYVQVSSLNSAGVGHAGAAMNVVVRAVLVQTAPSLVTDLTSVLTGESGIVASYYDGPAQGWPVNPILLNSIANAQIVGPGSQLGLLRLTTTNSQVASGGHLAVSLTAAGARQGRYPIQRVRISGFERGESAAPIYEVEAGAQSRYRVTSLL